MSGSRRVPRLPSSGSAPDIEELRKVHDKVFLGRLDGILQKYDRDFQGVADEIDLSTGEIVVNNGHISGARDSYDIGRPTHRPAPYVPVEAQDMTRQSPGNSNLLQGVQSVVHHHYAPELHQNMHEQRSNQPDFTSSVLRILERIERIEKRNELFHNQIAGQLGLLPPTDASHLQAIQQVSDKQHEAFETPPAPNETACDALEKPRSSPSKLKRRHASTGSSLALDLNNGAYQANPRKRSKRTKRSHDVWAIDYASSPEAETSSQRDTMLSDDNKNERLLKRSSAAERSTWTDEENKFLVNLVRDELRMAYPGKGKGGRWQRISTTFSTRFPGRGLVSVRSHLGTLIPGGMKTLRSDTEADKAGSARTSAPNLVDQTRGEANSLGLLKENISGEEDLRIDQRDGYDNNDNENSKQDESLSESQETSQRIQERQQKTPEPVRKAKPRLVRCNRKQDGYDKKMHIPPPKAYLQSLPSKPETPKHVRRSGRSRAQNSMRELLDQYESIFLESDKEEVADLSNWSSVASADEANVADGIMQAAPEYQNPEVPVQEKRNASPSHAKSYKTSKSKVPKKDKRKSLKLEPVVEEQDIQAPVQETLTVEAPNIPGAQGKVNAMRANVIQTDDKNQTPQKVVILKFAHVDGAPLSSHSSKVSIKQVAAANSSPKEVKAYPSPDSAKGKFGGVWRNSSRVPKYKTVTVPDSQESEPVSSSLDFDTYYSSPRPARLVNDMAQRKSELVKDRIVLDTKDSGNAADATQNNVTASPESKVTPFTSNDTLSTIKGRGRPKKGGTVLSSKHKSAKQCQPKPGGKSSASRRKSEPVKKKEAGKSSGNIAHFSPSMSRSKPQLSTAPNQEISTLTQTPSRPLASSIPMSDPSLNRTAYLAIMDDLSEDELA